jgi:putative salt-induced outer membrane protein YdiY
MILLPLALASIESYHSPQPETSGFDLAAPLAVDPPADDPKPEDLNKWKGGISAGGTVSDGNVHRKTATATGHAERRSEKDRWTLDFLWNFAEESGQVTERHTYGSAKYDRFLSKKAYLFGQTSGEYDFASTLDARWIAGAGGGYQFVENDHWKLLGELGVSYVDQDYKDNTADKSYPAARGAYKVDWTPNESWTAGQAAEIYPSLEHEEDVTARVDTHAKVMLSKSVFAMFQWIFAWNNTPPSGVKRTDDLYLLTVGWSF